VGLISTRLVFHASTNACWHLKTPMLLKATV
jgi:hypothetical protein